METVLTNRGGPRKALHQTRRAKTGKTVAQLVTTTGSLGHPRSPAEHSNEAMGIWPFAARGAFFFALALETAEC